MRKKNVEGVLLVLTTSTISDQVDHFLACLQGTNNTKLAVHEKNLSRARSIPIMR